MLGSRSGGPAFGSAGSKSRPSVRTPSDESIAVLDAKGLRQGLHDVYERLKRNKALPDIYGLGVVVLDGHESPRQLSTSLLGLFAANHPHCRRRSHPVLSSAGHVDVADGCAVRTGGRYACSWIMSRSGPASRKWETALRLLARVIPAYPRAFDVVLADARTRRRRSTFCSLTANTLWWVLKDERRNLYQDATGLWEQEAPQPGNYRSRQCRWWDFPDLLTWPQVQAPVRVVRSLETYTVRRQLDKQDDPQQSDWIWVTTLSLAQFPVDRIVHFRAPAMGYRELWLQRVG